ncbi:hypothetical protein L3X38_016969 [Prunus dulcis]|uniref:Uncharacterized protein n=1 Tax=Prunus dulcis TaxID=3755 RepID=A0AAD4W6D8_PRUDU|nr:hypothetical protein L3X38_016969 [Prunus dulcis]
MNGPVVDHAHFYGLGAKNRLKISSMTPSQLESLWQDAGDHSQPDPQSWQVSGTQSQPSRNPGRSRDTKSAEPQILALTVRTSP